MSLRDGADAKTNTQPCIEMLVRAAALVSINRTQKMRSSLWAWQYIAIRLKKIIIFIHEVGLLFRPSNIILQEVHGVDQRVSDEIKAKKTAHNCYACLSAERQHVHDVQKPGHQ